MFRNAQSGAQRALCSFATRIGIAVDRNPRERGGQPRLDGVRQRIGVLHSIELYPSVRLGNGVCGKRANLGSNDAGDRLLSQKRAPAVGHIGSVSAM